ncbi:MAG: hypothetical protein BGO07_01985 [Alphaproteobacteria bacterium 40-19]|nr:MAG: hypothetical protein BGO07_01985 [Alphaproteobacteria bacterium 40-19]
MGFESSSSRGRGLGALKAEINVTPFVDVMLVLLVIFMVTAPNMRSSIAVNLPQGGKASQTEACESVTVSIDSAGKVFFQDKLISLTDLIEQLKSKQVPMTEGIYIEADQDLAYSRVIEVMTRLSGAGYGKMVLITRPGGYPEAKKAKGAE